MPGASVEALKAEARPGLCVACDRALPPPKPGPCADGKGRGRKPRTVLCGHPDCERVYNTAAKADGRARRRAGNTG